ncbi:hypothetical protein MKW98_032505 [Papaver atlanticum]|uniref:Uncharacterized protein n=1 Tax=Papaver atlanticum TaxID=357466 RepID=A0AAD4SW85_9MAGN|nr:hypothetical protein MKW98_032505 [Papaver atlanticum]
MGTHIRNLVTSNLLLNSANGSSMKGVILRRSMLGTIESQKLQDMVLCRQVSLRRNGYGLYEAQWLVAELVLLAMYEMVLMNARMSVGVVFTLAANRKSSKSSSSSGVGGGGGNRGDSGGSDAGNDGSITGGNDTVNDSDNVAVSEDGGGVTAWKVVVMEEQAMVEMTSFEEASTLMMVNVALMEGLFRMNLVSS